MMQSRRTFLGTALATGLTVACATPVRSSAATSADIEWMTDGARGLFPDGAHLESLASGYTWSEGPVWDRVRNRLYFSDVPGNICWTWSEAGGAQEFLNPSGIPGSQAFGFREPGANGLAISRDGRLLICNHGKRAVEAMDLDTGARTILTGTYDGQKYNSPNDVIEAQDGTLFFTDPPYGLEGMNASPLKEQTANGVYRFGPNGTVTRLIDTMTFPNGVALSPDEQTVYVSQSDPEAPVILRMAPDGSGADILFDAAAYMSDDAPGLPDGMAVARSGHICATGPGGVFILSPAGKALARINTGKATANCCFGDADGQTLYITAHDTLVRIRTNLRGVAWS